MEVERALREQGLLTDVSEAETESQTGGETSEYELSPVKRPRTSEVCFVYKTIRPGDYGSIKL